MLTEARHSVQPLLPCSSQWLSHLLSAQQEAMSRPTLFYPFSQVSSEVAHTKVKVFIRSTKSVYSSVNGSLDFSGRSALSPVNFSYLHNAKLPVRAERREVMERKQAGAPTQVPTSWL